MYLRHCGITVKSVLQTKVHILYSQGDWLLLEAFLASFMHQADDEHEAAEAIKFTLPCASSSNGLWQYCTKASQPSATLVTKQNPMRHCHTMRRFENGEQDIPPILRYTELLAAEALFCCLGSFLSFHPCHLCHLSLPLSSVWHCNKRRWKQSVLKRQGKSVRHWKTTVQSVRSPLFRLSLPEISWTRLAVTKGVVFSESQHRACNAIGWGNSFKGCMNRMNVRILTHKNSKKHINSNLRYPQTLPCARLHKLL